MRAHVCQAECAVPLYIAQLASSAIHLKCFVVCTRTRHHFHCCKDMHVCMYVGVYVWACTRRLLTVIGARRCMHLWECVIGTVQCCDCCEAIHVCAFCVY
jgi:hypothetical protein